MTTRESRPGELPGPAAEPDSDLHLTGDPLAGATSEQIVSWARCWALWWRPVSVAYRAEQAEREYAERIRQVSYDLSTATRWSAIGPSHAELTSRRRLTSVLDCAMCGVAVEVEHPIPREQYDLLPDVSWVRCADHHEVSR